MMKKSEIERYQNIRGIKDILPDETWVWQKIENEFRQIMRLYNYSEIKIPVIEKTALFARSIGEETEIVSKEMYSFVDQGGDEISLRPEGTAGVVRAYIQHSMSNRQPVAKLYYIGPMFRRERPQKGRYRQFYQAGVELFGAFEPYPEIEQIVMLKDFFERLGIGNIVFIVNHLGTPESRYAYSQKLVEFFRGYKEKLCEDCKRRLEVNPLRILDCKKQQCMDVVLKAPSIEDSRPENSREYLKIFLDVLSEMGVDVKSDPKLVRGLDYYTGIVFEAVIRGGEGLTEGKNLSVVGGGRYDQLVAQLGGSPTPAVGFAIGMERLVELCVKIFEAPRMLEVFVTCIEQKDIKESLKILRTLRQNGFTCDFDPRCGSLKSQLKRADKTDAKFVVIVGGEEIQSGKLKVRNMKTGQQIDVEICRLSETLKKMLECNN